VYSSWIKLELELALPRKKEHTRDESRQSLPPANLPTCICMITGSKFAGVLKFESEWGGWLVVVAYR